MRAKFPRSGRGPKRLENDSRVLSSSLGRVVYPARGMPLDLEGAKGGVPSGAAAGVLTHPS